MNVKVRCHYLLTPHKISGEILVAKDSTGRYLMCSPAGSSTKGEEDLPVPPAPNQPRDRGRSPLRPSGVRQGSRRSGIFYSPRLVVPLLPLVWPHSLILGPDLPRCADRSIPCSIYVHCSGCGTFFNLATWASHTTSAWGFKSQDLH
jgi:hypothetical protein